MSSFLNFAPCSFRRVFTTQRGVVKRTFTTPSAKHTTEKVSQTQKISIVSYPLSPSSHTTETTGKKKQPMAKVNWEFVIKYFSIPQTEQPILCHWEDISAALSQKSKKPKKHNTPPHQI